MNCGSEGAGCWCTNEIVWVKKQEQGIQDVHPNEKALRRRQSSGEEMEGWAGRGKRRQGKKSEKYGGRLATRKLSKMFKNLQLASGRVGKWIKYINKLACERRSQWSDARANGRAAPPRQQVATNTDNWPRKRGKMFQTKPSVGIIIQKAASTRRFKAKLLSPSPPFQQQGAAWGWSCGENVLRPLQTPVQCDRARMRGGSCCGKLLCALSISIFRGCPNHSGDKTGRKEVAL